MSRIMNLQTVRFQIFNVLDTWHTNWADDYNYSHLLYEDLGIRSYFVGVFYRLRMPTNYVYIHRLAGGSALMLNTDIYFYKPLKRTKLYRYFIEQRMYFNYLLKLYVYLTPYLVRSINKQVPYRRYRRRYLNFFSSVRVKRFGRKGYLPFKSRSSKSLAGSRFKSIGDLKYLRHSYKTSCIYNGLLLAGFPSLQYKRKRTRRTTITRFYNASTTAFARIFSLLYYNSFLDKYVYLFKNISIALGLFYLTNVQAVRNVLYSSSKNLSTLFRSKFLYVKRSRPLFLTYNNYSFTFDVSNISNLYNVIYSCIDVLMALRKSKKRSSRQLRPVKRRFRKLLKKLSFIFCNWILSKLKVLTFFVIQKIITLVSFVFSRFVPVVTSSFFSFYNSFSALFNIRLSLTKRLVTTTSATFLNINSGKLNAIYFFNIIRNIHRRFYRNRRARVSVRSIPRKFQYNYLTRSYVTLLFSYLSKHIETVISSYTKQQVYFLYNLFYLGNKYYPAILNAKVLCDYFVYLIHTRRSMRGAFFKIRQWQIDNIKRRLSLESMYFKTKMRGKPLSYIDHLSYKKYPIIGIRIECSGNKKKGTMSRKTFYGDLIRDRLIFPKSPNNTFSADMDYYQSFAITKSCSVGVKVWVFFKTHLYDTHGAIKSLIVY